MHSSSPPAAAEPAGRDSEWHCSRWKAVRNPCPCHHLSYQPCVGRHSRRANEEAGLNFRKLFFCFSSSPTTGTSTGFPCYFPMRSESQTPRLLPKGPHFSLCAQERGCMWESHAFTLPSFRQRLGTENLLFGCKKKLLPCRRDADKYQRAGRVSGLG